MLPTMRTRTTWPGLFDEFLNRNLLPGIFDAESRHSLPAVNIIEGREDYRIEVAAPGLNKEDFKVSLENNVLTVSSEKEENQEEKDEKVMCREFSYYSFSRSFTLPMTVNSEKIRATHKEGILQVIIPKKEEAKEKPSREIKIS